MEQTQTKLMEGISPNVLKYHFEEFLGYEIKNEIFEAILEALPHCYPQGPAGYRAMGYRAPLWRLCKKMPIPCNAEEILAFFKPWLKEDKRHFRTLFLHIPHSSTEFPADSKYGFNDLDEEERLLIDYYTDELFLPQNKGKRIVGIVFPYCRLYCDVERMLNDSLEKKGFGISYHRYIPIATGYRYRSFSNSSEPKELYLDYHSASAKKIMKGYSPQLLIDCHSFSAKPTLLNPSPSDIDICIGFNEDQTKPNRVVIGNIEQHFKSLGYKVGINNPFSNSKTFPVPDKYYSVMIEVNKRLYMDEISLEKTSGFEKLQHDIQSLYEKLFKPSNY